ncbi:MAG: PEP-CTERM sorting domain-containing protein [Gammaproteobacteria bacterium]
MRLDTFSLVDKIYNNPAAYGLTNVNAPCYSRFVQSGGTTCANPNQYLFWDAEHPTSAVHRILATDVLRTVPEPATMALFVVGLAALVTVRKRCAV